MERFGALLRRVPLHDAGDRGHAEGGDEPTQCRQNPAAPPQGLSVGATILGGGPRVGLAKVKDGDYEVGGIAVAVETVPVEAAGWVVGPCEGGVRVAARGGNRDAIRSLGLQPAGGSDDNVGVGGEGAFGPCEVGFCGGGEEEGDGDRVRDAVVDAQTRDSEYYGKVAMRKKKLLEKPKAGKVEIPQEMFISALKMEG